jgi:hypothetical protein
MTTAIAPVRKSNGMDRRRTCDHNSGNVLIERRVLRHPELGTRSLLPRLPKTLEQFKFLLRRYGRFTRWNSISGELHRHHVGGQCRRPQNPTAISDNLGEGQGSSRAYRNPYGRVPGRIAIHSLRHLRIGSVALPIVSRRFQTSCDHRLGKAD